MAYFHVDAMAIRTDVTFDETTGEGGESVVGSRPNFVASFPPHIQLQIDTEVPVAMEVSKLHFFDEETGEPLR
jgi:hypothetical protein